MPGAPSARRRSASSTVPHIAIECVSPELDDGRFPVKRIIGDGFQVSADIFRDGHDVLAAHIRYLVPGETSWRTAPMVFEYNPDRWTGGFPLDRIGLWRYTVEAWTDRFASWRGALGKKAEAGQDVALELLEGADLVERAARRARGAEARTMLANTAKILRDGERDQRSRVEVAFAAPLLALMEEHLGPSDLTKYDRELTIIVDRERAGFAAWYEMFPRSQSEHAGVHGTFADAERALPRLAKLGFDVVYLPPIHPIGLTKRKGPNNSLEAGAEHPGSPWAIGSVDGGHTAIDSRLGTLPDFDRFVTAAHRLGMEIALDYALQCSPDHPWLREHPNWFFVRPDGTIKYAENPPKKYQDIYPLDMWCEDRIALWEACRDIFLFWIEHGVRTFRVDNPHTKPFAFWEWVLAEVRSRHPDAVFLSEAFTRPKRMKHLAKLGFTQSYTYFTWRNTAPELRDYLTELTRGPVAEYMRGNFFTNTPDILNEYLQHGGRPAFRARLLLAATLSPLYGIYSGFELCENIPLHAGSEEYLHSEKYEIRVRDWNTPGNLDADILRLNMIRRAHWALQRSTNLSFLPSENDQILFYRKTAPAGADDLLIAVNVDPFRAQEGMIHVPIAELGLHPESPYMVEDLLSGARYTWRGVRNYIRLDPRSEPGHVFVIRRP